MKANPQATRIGWRPGATPRALTSAGSEAPATSCAATPARVWPPRAGPWRARRATSERGQSTTEFALVLPLLLLLVIGTFWSSELLEAYNFVSYAAQAAARYAIVRGATSPQPATADDITSFVNNLAAGLNVKQLAVNATWTPNNQPGSTVAVQVQYAFQLNLPFMPAASIPLSATSTMTISQ